jgi:hypothetical protein
MRRRLWLIAAAGAVCGALALGFLVYPYVGSGSTCEGIGWGCTPERLSDSALVAIVFGFGALASLAIGRRRERRGGDWRRALRAGAVVTIAATAATVWSQLPRHPTSPGPLDPARVRMERILADGMAVAPRGTPLGDALHDLPRRGPEPCRDAYGRNTGARAYSWQTPRERLRPAAASGLVGAVTAAALGSWAARLRARGIEAAIDDPGGDPASDRRLVVGRFGPAGGGVLRVRSSFSMPELEITAGTGCHEG